MSQAEFTFTAADKARARGNAKQILALLEVCPQTSVQLCEVTHRFSASIKVLRNQGYEIQVRRLPDNTSLHTLLGRGACVPTNKTMQEAYYKTSHWQAKRLERLMFDEFACCWCHVKLDSLDVHHWHYDLFNEDLADLMSLCRTCHGTMHDNHAIKVHFPRLVTPEVAARLQPVEVFS